MICVVLSDAVGIETTASDDTTIQLRAVGAEAEFRPRVTLFAKIPHELTWDRARDCAAGSQLLIAFVTARPKVICEYSNEKDTKESHRGLV
jgi:hypothetical protein